MPILLPHEVTNLHIHTLQGLHLYNSKNSHCCKQVRLALSLKHIEYISHDVDIESKNEHVEQEYLGINPRGLVPALVHDGKVIVETTDILLYIDKTFFGSSCAGSNTRLIPGDKHDHIVRLLKQIDELHMHVRTISVGRLLRSVQTSKAKGVQLGLLGAMKREQEATDTGPLTLGGLLESEVGGQNRLANLKFWRQLSQRDFSTEERARAYTALFSAFLLLEATLKETNYLLGSKENDALTMVDVAWWPVVGRFVHILKEEKKQQFRENVPCLWAWYKRLQSKLEFQAEIESDTLLVKMLVGYKRTINVSNWTAFVVFLGAIVLLWWMIKNDV